MQVQPYLSYEGRCDEAIEFYEKAVGAKIDMLMRFKEVAGPVDSHTAEQGQGDACRRPHRRHANPDVGRPLHGGPNFNGIALALSAPTDADAERMFNALADGGKVNMPLTKTFFSSRFGMLADKFGVGWMVLVAHD